jgi:hypothetical protein
MELQSGSAIFAEPSTLLTAWVPASPARGKDQSLAHDLIAKVVATFADHA